MLTVFERGDKHPRTPPLDVYMTYPSYAIASLLTIPIYPALMPCSIYTITYKFSHKNKISTRMTTDIETKLFIQLPIIVDKKQIVN